MIYLASPYSHPDGAVRQARFEAACRAAAELIRKGHVVFSPIAHSHCIAQHGLPLDWGYWERHDERLLAACDELWVLKLDGWEQSRGVQAEIAIARELGKPVRFVSDWVWKQPSRNWPKGKPPRWRPAERIPDASMRESRGPDA